MCKKDINKDSFRFWRSQNASSVSFLVHRAWREKEHKSKNVLARAQFPLALSLELRSKKITGITRSVARS